MTKAKLFTTGGSQAVRLPAEFRFEGSEVDIRRDPVTGEVVLSKPMRSWDDYFDWARTLDLPDDFLERREQPKDDLRDRLTMRRGSGVLARDGRRGAPDAARPLRHTQPAPIRCEDCVDIEHHNGGARLW